MKARQALPTRSRCSDCGAELAFGQRKDGGLFPKRKDESGAQMENNGWRQAPGEGDRGAAAGRASGFPARLVLPPGAGTAPERFPRSYPCLVPMNASYAVPRAGKGHFKRRPQSDILQTR